MTKLQSTIILFFGIILSFHFSSATLYGLNSNYASIYAQLIVIDPVTAKMTNIGTPATNESNGLQVSDVDVKNNILYLACDNVTYDLADLVGMDLKTGKMLSCTPLSYSDSSIGTGQSCDFNSNTGEVYVNGPSGTGKENILYSVNPTAGTKKVLGSVATNGEVQGGAHAFDSKNNVLWFTIAVGPNSNITFARFDVATSKITLVDLKYNMETANFDPVTGLVIGIGFHFTNATAGYRIVVSLDSATNEFNVIGEITDYDWAWLGVGTLDPVNRKYYTILRKINETTMYYLVEFDLEKKTVTNSPQIGDQYCTQCPWNINWGM